VAYFYVLSLKSCIWIVVFTKTWSDMAFNVVVSYSTRLVCSVDNIRSIHDFFSPCSYVYRAGGPGYIPFKMYHPFSSHVSIIHFALVLVVVSSLSLYMAVSPIVGCIVPTRAFQSPQATERECGGMFPRMSSTSVKAFSSSIPRVWRLVAGGMYTLHSHIISPPYP
jgi:hypothetical protein